MNTSPSGVGSPAQARWAGGLSQQHGLNGTLVAKRFLNMTPIEGSYREETREIILWIQGRSLAPGGLKAVAKELVERWPVGRDGVPARVAREPLVLYGDSEPEFIVETLEELCLRPGSAEQYGSEKWQALRETMRAWETRQLAATTRTCVGREVVAACDYAASTRSLVLVTGPDGIGKRTAAQRHSETFCGRFRYSPVPTANDKTNFFRELAKPLGTGAALTKKANEMEPRAREMLQVSGLCAVFGDAQYFFPTTNPRDSQPDRLDWLVSALVEQGVGVVLISGPGFAHRLKLAQRCARWDSSAFESHVRRREIKARLDYPDFEAVARAMLPDGTAPSVCFALAAACCPNKHEKWTLRQLRRAVDDVLYAADQAGRQAPTDADVCAALRPLLVPSDVSPEDLKVAVQKRSSLQFSSRAGSAHPTATRSRTEHSW